MINKRGATSCLYVVTEIQGLFMQVTRLLRPALSKTALLAACLRDFGCLLQRAVGLGIRGVSVGLGLLAEPPFSESRLADRRVAVWHPGLKFGHYCVRK